MESEKSIKRSELYRLLWSQPTTKVARSFGLSDVGLAKICRRHDIPRPPRGYWAQRQHGQQPDQTPLPSPRNDPLIEMGDRPEKAEPTGSADIAGSGPAKPEPFTVVVAETLRGCHTLVSKANDELDACKTDSDGIILPGEARTLDVRTSKATCRRALLIFDALLKASERLGYSVAAGPTITILGHAIQLGIHEMIDVKRQEAETADLEGSYTFGHSKFESIRTPTGKLSMSITAGRGNGASFARSTWSDSDKSRLEERLGKILSSLADRARREQEYELEVERQRELRRQEELKRQEAERQRAERRKLFKAEKARLKQLLDQVESFGKSKLLREFIEAVRQKHSSNGPVTPDSEIGAWIEWATLQAERLDPLRPSPSSILDEKFDEDDEGRSPYGQQRWDSSPPPSYWEQRNWWNRNR